MTESPKYVGPGGAIKLVFKNFLNFGGRSTRSEYWWVCFVGLIIGVLVYAIMFVASTKFHIYAMNVNAAKTVMTVLSVITFIPSVTLAARRLHDTGHGFGWIFINILPIIGSIWFLVLLLKASGPANKWGVPAGQQGMAGGMPGMGGYPNGMNGQMMGQRQGQPMPGQPYAGQPMQPGMQQPGFGQGGMQGMAQGAMNMMGQAFGGGQPGQSPLSSLGGAAATLGAAAMGAMHNLGQGQNPFAGMGGNPGMGGMQGMGRVCPNCGMQLTGNDMFCQNCGTRLM
ncbi:MAG: DUF805 domain-containing protein [Treponema sp.]|nr:DUF805 domain-containing protein [Treponema sp.]